MSPNYFRLRTYMSSHKIPPKNTQSKYKLIRSVTSEKFGGTIGAKMNDVSESIALHEIKKTGLDKFGGSRIVSKIKYVDVDWSAIDLGDFMLDIKYPHQEAEVTNVSSK